MDIRTLDVVWMESILVEYDCKDVRRHFAVRQTILAKEVTHVR